MESNTNNIGNIDIFVIVICMSAFMFTDISVSLACVGLSLCRRARGTMVPGYPWCLGAHGARVPLVPGGPWCPGAHGMVRTLKQLNKESCELLQWTLSVPCFLSRAFCPVLSVPCFLSRASPVRYRLVDEMVYHQYRQ